jgi:hypothetical protein
MIFSFGFLLGLLLRAESKAVEESFTVVSRLRFLRSPAGDASNFIGHLEHFGNFLQDALSLFRVISLDRRRHA